MRNKRKLLGFLVMVLGVLPCSLTIFAADTAMKNKKWLSGQGGAYVEEDKDGMLEYKDYGTSYYKIKVPKQGYIIVDAKVSKLPGADKYQEQEYGYGTEGTEEGSAFVNLLDSSKKSIYKNDNYFGAKNKLSFSWAVKKGTYYLAVGGSQKYKIRYSFTPVAKINKAGERLRGAVLLKKGATVKNLLFDVDKSHYYKINVPKRSKVTISVNSKIKESNLDMGLFLQLLVVRGDTFDFVDNKGKLLPKDDLVTWVFKGKDKLVCNFPRGTYYLRVGSYYTTGYYTLKWN